MFSELRHHPRSQWQIAPYDPVPASVDHNWQGFPGKAVAQRNIICADVTGSNRSKYFRRPIIPFSKSIPATYVLEPPM